MVRTGERVVGGVVAVVARCGQVVHGVWLSDRVGGERERATPPESTSSSAKLRRWLSLQPQPARRVDYNQLDGMNSPNGGGFTPIPTIPDADPLPITLDPEVEELWSSRALLIVSFT